METTLNLLKAMKTKRKGSLGGSPILMFFLIITIAVVVFLISVVEVFLSFVVVP